MTRAQKPCLSPAMANGRCRMHGGRSPGAPRKNSNALKHGRVSAKAAEQRAEVTSLIRAMRELIEQADS
ncbi:HGGxSTG domain-containing protein [Pseudoponticoccus marisrubri]|uniref:HGGxSTG domain-containing protein n=1 Tax=Pseudoponticoccus marisrubri TaxID=1685382 RepID=UPI003462F4A8